MQVARACAALSYAHSGVLRLASECMAQGEQLPDDDFDLLSQALEDLGMMVTWRANYSRSDQRPAW